MKTWIAVSTAMVTLLAVSGVAQADVFTLTFDPDVLIQSYPGSAGASDVAGQNKLTQLDARRLHQPWGTVYETFYNPANPQVQPNSYNTYMNWRDSLDAGEGIAMFNSWFLDQSNVRSWGETVVIKPGTTVTGTAADGWNVRVIDQPYGLGGASVQWWTTDSSKYINTISNIGEFSITADLYWDNDADGWDASDPSVAVGDSIRFWAGNLNGDDPEFYRSDTQALYFDDEGWGNRSPASSSSPFSAIYATGSNTPLGSGFEAVLTTTVVPLPAAVLLGMLGLSAAGLRLRKHA